MTFKSLLPAAALLALTTGTCHAKNVWHLVADGIDKIPVASIEYIASHPEGGTLDIVLNDGHTVYTGVTSTSFDYCEEAGITDATTEHETIIGPYADTITVKGLKAGSTIALYNSQGIVLSTYTATQQTGAITIDIASLASGIYVLKTQNTAVKFIKE